MVDNLIWFLLGAASASTVWFLLSVRAENITQRHAGKTLEQVALDEAFRRAQR